MENGVRGIEANLDYKKCFQPYQLLENIPLQDYKVYLQWCLTSNILETCAPRIITHHELEKLSEKDSIWELVLHIIPPGAPARRIDNYEEFLSGPCQCSILFYDCANLEIYVKKEAWFKILKDNILKMSPQAVRIKTDTNDSRERFL